MVTAKKKAKNGWGGKRKGAGRPRDPESIRSDFAEMRRIKARHSYTLSEVALGRYIMNHKENVHWLVDFCSAMPRPWQDNPEKKYITLSRAYKLVRDYSPEKQAAVLLTKFPGLKKHVTEVQRQLTQKRAGR